MALPDSISRRVLFVSLGVLVFCAFFIHSLGLHSRLTVLALREVVGYDYATFLAQLRSFEWITYTGARHPGLGLVLSPLVCVVAAADLISVQFGDGVILLFFAAVGAFNALLVCRLGGWKALVLWLLFGLTWLWASIPESFPIAQTLLLVALVGADSRLEERFGSRRAVCFWLLLAVVSSLVTVTNGVKIILAGLICSSALRRQWKRLFVGGIVVMLLGVAFFAVRMMLWNAHHPEAPKTILTAVGATASWIPADLSLRVWSGLVVRNLFVRPLSFLFDWTSLTTPPAVTIFQVASATILWLGALTGAIRHRADRVTQVIGVCFFGDFVLHGICSWGLAEGWLFSAHYLPFLPILIGRFFGRLAPSEAVTV